MTPLLTSLCLASITLLLIEHGRAAEADQRYQLGGLIDGSQDATTAASTYKGACMCTYAFPKALSCHVLHNVPVGDITAAGIYGPAYPGFTGSLVHSYTAASDMSGTWTTGFSDSQELALLAGQYYVQISTASQTIRGQIMPALHGVAVMSSAGLAGNAASFNDRGFLLYELFPTNDAWTAFNSSLRLAAAYEFNVPNMYIRSGVRGGTLGVADLETFTAVQRTSGYTGVITGSNGLFFFQGDRRLDAWNSSNFGLPMYRQFFDTALTLVAELQGAHVVPSAVSTSNSGSVILFTHGSLRSTGTVHWQLSHGMTASAIHIRGQAPFNGTAAVAYTICSPCTGTSGVVIVDFGSTSASNSVQSSGLYYVNVETAAFPSGELRGQLYRWKKKPTAGGQPTTAPTPSPTPSPTPAPTPVGATPMPTPFVAPAEVQRFQFSAVLQKAQVVGSSSSAEVGVLLGQYNNVNKRLSYTVTSTISVYTGAGIRGPAFPGVSAAQVHSLDTSLTPIRGVFQLDDTTELDFLKGKYYVELSSSAGAIRGQINGYYEGVTVMEAIANAPAGTNRGFVQYRVFPTSNDSSIFTSKLHLNINHDFGVLANNGMRIRAGSPGGLLSSSDAYLFTSGQRVTGLDADITTNALLNRQIANSEAYIEAFNSSYFSLPMWRQYFDQITNMVAELRGDYVRPNAVTTSNFGSLVLRYHGDQISTADVIWQLNPGLTATNITINGVASPTETASVVYTVCAPCTGSGSMTISFGSVNAAFNFFSTNGNKYYVTVQTAAYPGGELRGMLYEILSYPQAGPPLPAMPTVSPSSAPTPAPTRAPSAAPTSSPTVAPGSPSLAPTSAPTPTPTATPTSTPSQTPTAAPSPAPTPSFVDFTLTFPNKSLSSYPAGSAARSTFEGSVVSELASVLNVSVSRFTVKGLRSGSVLMDIRLSDLPGQPSSVAVRAMLDELVLSPNSQVYNATLFPLLSSVSPSSVIPATPSPTPPPSNSSSNAGAIAGGVIGGLVVVVLAVFGIHWYMRRKAGSKSYQNDGASSEMRQQPRDDTSSEMVSPGEVAGTQGPPLPPRTHVSYPSTLPPGWQAVKDENGAIYYYNQDTGLSQWDAPTA